MASSLALTVIVGYQKSFSFDWIKYGVRVETYRFSVFLESKDVVTQANLNALVLPFDVITWILIFLVGLTIWLMSFVVTEQGTLSILWLLGTLLDQSDLLFVKIFTSKKKKTCFGGETICILPLTGWIITTLLLGFFYKGALFSYMTTTPLPDVPTNLKDLLISDIPIITTTYLTSVFYPIPVSPLEMLCKDFLEILGHESPLADVADGLLRRTIFVPAFHKVVDITENISLSRPITTCANPHTWNCTKKTEKGSVVLRGKKFAVISVKEDIAAFSNYLSYFDGKSSKFIQIREDSPNPVIFRVPWIAYYNGVYDIFSRHFGALVESGIHSWWNRNSHVAGQVRLLIQNKFQIKSSNEHVSIPGLLQRIWIRSNVAKVPVYEGTAGLGGVEIKMVMAPFVIWCTVLGISCLIFSETLYVRRRWRPFIQNCKCIKNICRQCQQKMVS